MLDSLPALTRRMRLSVNVWTPELDAFQGESLHKNDYKRYLVDHDPGELIEESKNAWRCVGKFKKSSNSFECFLAPYVVQMYMY